MEVMFSLSKGSSNSVMENSPNTVPLCLSRPFTSSRTTEALSELGKKRERREGERKGCILHINLLHFIQLCGIASKHFDVAPHAPAVRTCTTSGRPPREGLRGRRPSRVARRREAASGDMAARSRRSVVVKCFPPFDDNGISRTRTQQKSGRGGVKQSDAIRECRL